MLRKAVNPRVQNRTTNRVAMPPAMMEGATPNQAAASPDSNSPSSLDAPMNTEFTALTRPRMASGVSNCTSICLINTLTISPTPSNAKAARDK